MSPMRPELALKHKIRALEQKKALFDALIAFLKKHPEVASAAVLKQLSNRTGLYFDDYALVRPMWVKDHVALRLEKFSEYWEGHEPEYDTSKRTVSEDISGMSGEELQQLLSKLEHEADEG
jgi:hypothetical protein